MNFFKHQMMKKSQNRAASDNRTNGLSIFNENVLERIAVHLSESEMVELKKNLKMMNYCEIENILDKFKFKYCVQKRR